MVPKHVLPRSAGFVTVQAQLNDKYMPETVFLLTGMSDSLNLKPREADCDAFDISQ